MTDSARPVSLRQLAKAAGIKFPHIAMGICRNCGKTFAWTCKHPGQKKPSFCEKHDAKSFKPVERKKTCMKCGNKFMWRQKKKDATPPATCLNHRNEDTKYQGIVCPSPDKQKFATKRDAERHSEYMSKSRGHVLRAYRCECSIWHVTSKKVPKYK